MVKFFSSLFLVVNLNPKDQKNTTWPYRPYLWGPPFLAQWHPKHGRNCRYETLTLDNSTPSGLFFKQSVSGGKPEPKRPEKHNLATQTLTLGSANSLALPLKHLRYCHNETLTLNNFTPSGPIFKQPGLVVNLNSMDHRNTPLPYRSRFWGPLFRGSYPPEA